MLYSINLGKRGLRLKVTGTVESQGFIAAKLSSDCLKRLQKILFVFVEQLFKVSERKFVSKFKLRSENARNTDHVSDPDIPSPRNHRKEPVGRRQIFFGCTHQPQFKNCTLLYTSLQTNARAARHFASFLISLEILV